MSWLLLAAVVFVAAFAAVAAYAWLKSEWDERQWRRIMQEELGMPRFTYRMVMDDKDGSDRE
jgi:hypothetical protein